MGQLPESWVHRQPPVGHPTPAGEPLQGKVDFALYQPGTLEILAESPRPGSENVRFVANLYSLVASALIAMFLGGRWVREQRARRQKHRLDSHVRALLEIEKQQIALDGLGGADDLETLQRLDIRFNELIDAVRRQG